LERGEEGGNVINHPMVWGGDAIDVYKALAGLRVWYSQQTGITNYVDLEITSGSAFQVQSALFSIPYGILNKK